jgi:HK97 family phage major capsid protein
MNMSSIQERREARNAKAQEIHTIANKDAPTVAELAQLDTLYGEVEEIDGQIARINRSNELVAATTLGETIGERIAGIGHNSRHAQSDEVRAFTAFLRHTPAQLGVDDVALIRQTMSTTTQTEGGYTVPTEVAAKLLVAMKKYGAMRAVATILTTATGAPLQFPTADPTSEVGEIVPENVTTTALDTSFGTIAVPCFKYSSKVVRIPLELLQDSIVDIEAYVVGLLAMRLGRISSTHFTTGTGVGQPYGILTLAGVGATGATGEATSIKPDSLIELFHSVDPAYREMNNVGWMFNDQTLKTIRKIKDNNARYMFIPGFETGVPGGVPDTLLGKPITVNQQMPAMAANAKSILFGDFSFYTIRDAMDMLTRRFDDSPFALAGQAGFCAWMRMGGNLVDVGGAVKAFVNSAS